MAGYSQTGRLISLSVSGLDADKLLLASFKGHEAMSRLFSFNLELLMDVTDPETQQPNDPVQFTDVIGKNATISVTLSDNTQRCFNGIVSQFALTAVDVKFVHYEMEVVPWTWLLTRYADCKIFHNKAVGDIIQQVFSDRSQTDFKVSLTATYPTLEYCVQYRETDFNFISRLMEQFGIFYFFQHEEGKHTMVIADSSSAYEDCWPGHSSFGFNLASGGLDDDDVVNAWSTEQLLKSGMCTLADYNFKTPSTYLVNQDPTVYAIGGNSGFELFDYPGLYINNADGKAMAKLRMEEVEAGHLIARGSSVCRAFTSGTKFTLTAHPQDALNGNYLITEVQHRATVAGNYTGDGSAGEYANHFSCIPDDVVFRPARVTPKPFVQGPQTAVVIGTNPDSGASESSDEIWVDSFGRVVVLFPWDRKNACSCWVRVSQDWAGQGWGSITIPRIGQEVIVSFLEGDPDRPIITGRVYNANQTVPYPLPANQTRSTFMTRSSKGGDASTYNELRFEDLKGKEQVFVRAQFDYDTQVLHDSREAIGNNRSLTVKVNQLESVGGDLHSTVSGGVFESVGKDVNTTITGGVIESVGKDVNTAITGAYVESVGKDSNSNITGNLNLKTGQAISINAGTNLVESSGQAFSHNAGMSIDLKGGTTVTIEAGVTLT
ncbi:MAG: type VI secretion system Vgr family protein, partial [Terracidiphilus sp.]